MFKFNYDKLHLKEITILVPRGSDNLVSVLTPILGLYGINVKDFLLDFELKTQFVLDIPDLLIPVRVKISKIKTFEIMVKTPYLASIIPTELTILEVYKLFLIKSSLLKNKEKFYNTFRYYLNQVASVVFSENIPKTFILLKSSIKLYNMAKRFNLTKRLAIQFSNLNYGVFFNWNNFKMSYINSFKIKCQSYMLNFVKVGKLRNQFIQGINGNIYSFFSHKLSYMIYPMQVFLGLFRRSNYYPISYKFGYNLFTLSNFTFIQSILNNFSLFFNKLHFYILKILKFILINIVLLLNKFRKNIIILCQHFVK
jgi:hypothetical protein